MKTLRDIIDDSARYDGDIVTYAKAVIRAAYAEMRPVLRDQRYGEGTKLESLVKIHGDMAYNAALSDFDANLKILLED